MWCRFITISHLSGCLWHFKTICICYTYNIERASQRFHCVVIWHSFTRECICARMWYTRPHITTFQFTCNVLMQTLTSFRWIGVQDGCTRISPLSMDFLMCLAFGPRMPGWLGDSEQDVDLPSLLGDSHAAWEPTWWQQSPQGYTLRQNAAAWSWWCNTGCTEYFAFIHICIYICIIGTPEKTYIFFQCFRDLNIELSRFHATLSQESSSSNVQAQQGCCLIIEYLRFRGKLFQESSMFNVQSTNNSMLDLLIFMNVSNYWWFVYVVNAHIHAHVCSELIGLRNKIHVYENMHI